MTIHNCVSILSCADLLSNEILIQRGLVIMRESFVKLGPDPNVPIASMQTLLESKRLNVSSEEQVFITLVAWMQNLAGFLGDSQRLNLFVLVHFPLLSQEFIESTVIQEPMFINSWLDDYYELFFGGDREMRNSLRLHRERMPGSNILSVEDDRQLRLWTRKKRSGPQPSLERIYCGSSDGFKSTDFHDRYTHL